MDTSDTINLALKVMLLTGLAVALLFVGLQLLIRELEKARRHPGNQ